MKALLWFLALFALAAALVLGARLNDGYVLLVLPPWRAELSLNLFGLALLAVLAAGYLLLRMLSAALALPTEVRAYRARRSRERAVAVFQDAVRLLFEGRFGQALKKASEAHAAGTAPGLSALIAARAAQRLREPEKQQGWLTRAKLDDPRTDAATLMLEAEMMNEEHRYADALVALERLQQRQGRHIAALRLELRARQGVGDWDGVLKLLRQLDKRAALPAEMVRGVRDKAHQAKIAQLIGEPGRLLAYLQGLPAGERGPRVVLAAAPALLQPEALTAAQAIIEETLEAAGDDGWLPELAELYGRLDGGDQTARIARAGQWLRRHPDDARLLLGLGGMCRRQRLWGKAQNYLEASLSVEPTRAAHLELARLMELLERADEANRHYRAAALLDAA